MQIIHDAQQRVQEFVSQNSSTLLTAGGVVGTVATAVVSARAGYKAHEAIVEHPMLQDVGEDEPELRDRTRSEKIQLVWSLYIPPVITGGATVASIIMANRMSSARAAALAAAYGLSQKQFEEYKAKVTEKLTGPKKQQIDDELAQERVNRATGSSQIVIMGDEVICFDEPTGRFFKSSMEKIGRAVNSANAEIIHHGFVSASYFYSELELDPTTWSDEVGWNQPFDINVTTTMTNDQKPCLSIDFKTLPSAEYMGPKYQ